MSDYLRLPFHAALRPFWPTVGNGMTTPQAPPEALSEPLPETLPRRLTASASSDSLNSRTATCSRPGVSGSRRGGNNTNSDRFDIHGRTPAEEAHAGGEPTDNASKPQTPAPMERIRSDAD
jgi:hypothetical protein